MEEELKKKDKGGELNLCREVTPNISIFPFMTLIAELGCV
jgi:hypothetical protein